VASREPFSRHRAPEPGERDPDIALLAAYEFAASAYGWSPSQVRDGLTDELFVGYLDAATDRIRREFVERVDAARIARAPDKAYRRWRQKADRHAPKKSLSGAALESAVMNVARMFPKNVIHGTA
jgi:hypothetical protein